MSLKLKEIKKHLSKGDLKEIEMELKKANPGVRGFSYPTISAVMRGERKSTKVLEALIARAEKNKEESDLLASRTKKL